MTVVDGSVWVSYFAHDDVNHRQTRDWFQLQTRLRAQYEEPRLALVEVAASIARRSGRPAAGLRAYERLSASPTITFWTMSDDYLDDVARLAAELRLRAADATYVALAHRLGVRLVTWDREQLTRGAALVQTTTPADDLAGDS